MQLQNHEESSICAVITHQDTLETPYAAQLLPFSLEINEDTFTFTFLYNSISIPLTKA